VGTAVDVQGACLTARQHREGKVPPKKSRELSGNSNVYSGVRADGRNKLATMPLFDGRRNFSYSIINVYIYIYLEIF